MTTTVDTVQADTDLITRTEINDPRHRLAFIPQLFSTPQGEQMAINFMRKHCEGYDGGYWNYYEIPRGITGCITHPTGYITPPEGTYRLEIPGNYFNAEVSADAAGIITTLFVLNQLAWMVSAMGEKYVQTCQALVDRQDALKDYISSIKHPEKHLIFRAID
ncbi:antirestriction protein [Salmonella enterica subsp. enterica serovar Legon]|nr:antirestriction protein [Salmonella enterica subsp. enterica serovar Legon]EDW9825351.1 antirestriction protein [Salmonella enterica]EDZ3589400.1 antirestriction protein [Salmonella enterica subsp. enterica serovar Wagenia]EHL5833695.1 antirestriction protein [Salmonella enterica]